MYINQVIILGILFYFNIYTVVCIWILVYLTVCFYVLGVFGLFGDHKAVVEGQAIKEYMNERRLRNAVLDKIHIIVIKLSI